MKKYVISMLIITMMTSLFCATVFAEEADPTVVPPGQLTKAEKQAAKDEKFLANKEKIAAKKDELDARKEAFFALKEQTKAQVDEQKALIKEQKQNIIEQIHLINEMSDEEKVALKAEIKEMWQEVRNTQRYLWQIRQVAGDEAKLIFGKVEVVDEEDLEGVEIPDVGDLIDEL